MSKSLSASSPTPHLLIENVCVQYGAHAMPAVHNVSFSLEKGEVGVLMGPSGCGKTTLLRAIAGLEALSQGCISMSGRHLSTASTCLAPAQRKIGLVFQDYALFPHLSVEDNIAFGLRFASEPWPAEQIQSRVSEMLALVSLETFAKRMPHELSGGQQQRVALARALAPGPEILLLDEPFSNLDVELREQLSRELRTILKKAQVTALFVTHDQHEAFSLGDLVGVMHQGQLEQWSTPYALYHKPATRNAAQFIGLNVFLPVTWHSNNPTKLNTPLGSLPAPGKTAQGRSLAELANIRVQSPLVFDMLMRADDLVFDAHSPVLAKIVERDFRGASCLYTLVLEGGHTVLALAPSHQQLEPGQTIGVRADLEDIVLFESAA